MHCPDQSSARPACCSHWLSYPAASPSPPTPQCPAADAMPRNQDACRKARPGCCVTPRRCLRGNPSIARRGAVRRVHRSGQRQGWGSGWPWGGGSVGEKRQRVVSSIFLNIQSNFKNISAPVPLVGKCDLFPYCSPSYRFLKRLEYQFWRDVMNQAVFWPDVVPNVYNIV